MKKLLALLLVFSTMASMLTGCGLGLNSGSDLDERQPDQEAAEAALDSLAQSLELSREQSEQIVSVDVRTYEDETVVRCVQTYEGVEIYGSSLVTTSAQDGYLAGTYYDLSDTFGEDFSDLIAQASTRPQWLVEATGATVQWDTYRPVIYVTEDGEAYVAVCFRAELYADGMSAMGEFVISYDGSLLLEAVPVKEYEGFTDAKVTTEDGTFRLSKDGNTYYAYQQANNVYVAKEFLHQDKWKDAHKKYISSSTTQNGFPTTNVSEDLMYSTNSKDWSQDKSSKTAIDFLNLYCNVNQWYTSRFGYKSLDGEGGPVVLAVMSEDSKQTAINRNGAMIQMKTNAFDYPEVMTHEFFHSVFARVRGVAGGTQNETAALNEGLADTFGALYVISTLSQAERSSANTLKNSWILCNGFGKAEKDIPGTDRTMDDYQFDRYSDHEEEFDSDNDLKDVVNGEYWIYFADLGLNVFFGDSCAIRTDDLSTNSSHYNAFIISNLMYKLWNGVFEKDDVALGDVLFRALRYLPNNADFADFRDAFLYSMRLSYSTEKVAAAQGYFSNKGIEHKKTGSIIKANEKKTAGSDKVTLVDLMEMPYSKLKSLVWDEFYYFTSIDYPDELTVSCSVGECYYYLTYLGYTLTSAGEPPADALPVRISGQDFRQEGKNLAIYANYRLGMTYEEMMVQYSNSAYDMMHTLTAPQFYDTDAMYGWNSFCYVDDYRLTVNFGSGSSPDVATYAQLYLDVSEPS